MQLIIDIGNTRAKLAWFDGDRLLRVERAPAKDRTAILGYAAEEHVAAIAIGSVGVTVDGLLEQLSAHAKVLHVTGASPAPIQNDYGTQGSLGADRWANAVAAAAQFPRRAVLAIDAGTCITYDVVLAEGVYAGGAISPGFGLRAAAMHGYSARLPLVELGAEMPGMFASSTRESLLSGVWHGVIHESQGFTDAFLHRFPGGGVLVTGGDGLRLSRGLKSGIFAHPFLTLEGYRRILHHHLNAGLDRV